MILFRGAVDAPPQEARVVVVGDDDRCPRPIACWLDHRHTPQIASEITRRRPRAPWLPDAGEAAFFRAGGLCPAAHPAAWLLAVVISSPALPTGGRSRRRKRPACLEPGG